MENRLSKVVKENKELQNELKNAKTKEEAFKLISPFIVGYTVDEMVKDLKAASSESALSDNELEAVAGGVSREDIYVSDQEFFESLFGWIKKFWD